MRVLNVIFTDEEFKMIEEVKNYCEKSWHDFILLRVSAIKSKRKDQ